MIRVDHINVVKIGGSGFVGKVYGVLKRDIPNREGLKLSIACFAAAYVIVIKLGKAGRHFAAARAGSGDDHQGALGFDIIVFTETVIAEDQLYIGRIIGNSIMAEDLDTEVLQPLLKSIYRGLRIIMGNANAAYEKAYAAEGVNKAEYVQIVGYTEIAADLVLFNIARTDNDYYFGLILKLHKHTDLAVGLKAGKHTGGVEIVEKLAAKLQIKLTAEFIYTVYYALGLQLKIFIVIKTDLAHFSLNLPSECQLLSKKQHCLQYITGEGFIQVDICRFSKKFRFSNRKIFGIIIKTQGLL